MRRPVDEDQNHRKMSRRALLLGGSQLAFMGVLVARMHHLQVEASDQYRLLAEENRIDVSLLKPRRGLIYDRQGQLIAGNEQIYRLFIKREDAGDVDQVLARLGRLIPLQESQVARAKREMQRRPAFVSILVADGLSWEDVSRVSVNAPVLPGVIPEVGQRRVYPLGLDFAHTVGYLGRVSERDLEVLQDDDPLLLLPDFEVGKIGVERRLDPELRGRAGTRRVERNAVGRIMRELDRSEGIAGNDLQLTLDANLQHFTAKRLGTQSAAVVVMDVQNGDLISAVSSPAYDPNEFIGGISQSNYDKLRLNDHRPLHNKIVQGLYPPGSTFKMVTLLAALEDGAVTPTETIRCNGFLTLGNRRFHCWKRRGHGNVNAHTSLVESCDTYYYDIAQRVGVEKIAAMARKLGLGVAHDVPMTSVSGGLIPDKSWKERNRDESWLVGDTLNTSIGQGFVLASPLQLAVMTAQLASGKQIIPHMVRARGGIEPDLNEAPPLDIDPAHLAIVRRAMFGVMGEGRGTAYRSRITAEGQEWAGKTGTSQVRNISAAERARGVFRNEDLPWRRRDHALFVGYAPYDNPKYAISVVVEHGGGGSTAAAPVARDVMLAALNGGRPPLTGYPSQQRDEIRQMLDDLDLREMHQPSGGVSKA